MPTAILDGNKSRTSDADGRMQNDSVEALVQDPSQDIAKSQSLEQMVVGVPGRREFQKIYMRDNTSTLKYNPSIDAPPIDHPLSVTPSKEEVDGGPKLTPYLVVGLVLADEPSKYTTKGTGRSRNKELEEIRKKRGVLPQEARVLRAVIRQSEFIQQTSPKYYVAVHPESGLSTTRLITADTILFFSEFWVDVQGDARTRRLQLGAACKRHAAVNQNPLTRETAEIRENAMSSDNELNVSMRNYPALLLMLQFSIHQLTKSPESVDALLKTFEDVLPDMLKPTSNKSSNKFFDFDKQFDTNQAEKLVVYSQVSIQTANKKAPSDVYTEDQPHYRRVKCTAHNGSAQVTTAIQASHHAPRT